MDATHPPRSFAEARELSGLTMEEVATHVGVTRQAVGQWGAGASPSGPSRRLLAQLFAVDLAVVDSWFATEEAERATA